METLVIGGRKWERIPISNGGQSEVVEQLQPLRDFQDGGRTIPTGGIRA